LLSASAELAALTLPIALTRADFIKLNPSTLAEVLGCSLGAWSRDSLSRCRSSQAGSAGKGDNHFFHFSFISLKSRAKIPLKTTPGNTSPRAGNTQ
jgi:hypothetical protein